MRNPPWLTQPVGAAGWGGASQTFKSRGKPLTSEQRPKKSSLFGVLLFPYFPSLKTLLVSRALLAEVGEGELEFWRYKKKFQYELPFRSSYSNWEAHYPENTSGTG